MIRRLGWMTVAMASAALTPALAQPVTGPYVSLGFGGNILQDEPLQSSLGPLNSKVSFNNGEAGIAGLGWGFGNGFRLQLEGDWRRNGLNSVTNLGSPVGTSGNQQNYGALADLIFDMDVGASWVYPYFGAGVGYSTTEWNNVLIAAGPAGSPDRLYGTANGSTSHFAYTGLFGLSFPIPYVVGLSLTAEYRFFGVSGKTSFPGTISIGDTSNPGRARFGGGSDLNHTGLIGLRYELFPPPPPAPPAPAAPPPPAPAVEQARTYLVFFDWDRADLTDRARQIVAEAAQASQHVQTTRIEVNGYTDLSGSAAYNQKLSVRRAQSVEAELVRDGVPRQEIEIHGYGESDPLVPTAQGVREPQNRRVQIILH